MPSAQRDRNGAARPTEVLFGLRVQFRCIVLCLPSETPCAWGVRVESAATTRRLERRASPKSPADTNSGLTCANWLGVGNGLPRV